MIKLYKYLYYRLYTWNKRNWGEKDFPQWNALFGVSFIMYVNLGVLAAILDIMGFNIFIEETPKNEIIIFGFIILTLNYFWLVRNGKYKQIANEYKNEPQNKRVRNKLLLWLYVILSFVIISLLAIVSGKLKGLQ